MVNISLVFVPKMLRYPKSNKGNIKGPIFSIELLGDAIMVTLKIEETFISVKVNNDFEASMGDMVNISINSSKCQIFDIENGFNLNLK